MEFRDVRAFIAVAEEQSFTKAARRLGTSQPALSRQIWHLEQELGTTLFVRSDRKTDLTQEGRLLLGAAQSISTQVSEFQNTARALQSELADREQIALDRQLRESPGMTAQRRAAPFDEALKVAIVLLKVLRFSGCSNRLTQWLPRPPRCCCLARPEAAKKCLPRRYIAPVPGRAGRW